MNCRGESNIEDMRARHKAEVRALQNKCKHSLYSQRSYSSLFEKRLNCENCGKLLERIR